MLREREKRKEVSGAATKAIVGRLLAVAAAVVAAAAAVVRKRARSPEMHPMARRRQTVTGGKMGARRIAARRMVQAAVRRVRRTAAAVRVTAATPKIRSATPIRKRLASQRKPHLLVLLLVLLQVLVLLLLLLLRLGIRRKKGEGRLAERAKMLQAAEVAKAKAVGSGVGPSTTEARAGRHPLLAASEGEGVDRPGKSPGKREGLAAVPEARKGGGGPDGVGHFYFIIFSWSCAGFVFCNIHS